MPFIPHTTDEVKSMLATLNVAEVNQLFDEIPKSIKAADLSTIPSGLTEIAMSRVMQAREPHIQPNKCFLGGGAYDHFVPAITLDLISRGEFYTAYTPYQAEASQGSLQVIYEYQTMIARLTVMDVANASIYDGATSLVEAVLMALRIKGAKARRILVPQSLHPHYRQVLASITQHNDVILDALPLDFTAGTIDLNALNAIDPNNIAALIIPQPNFFGCLEAVDQLTDWAHQQQALAIAVVNPLALALLKPPGEWGANGADIVCGEGQSLGVPLQGGGPYFGIMSCKSQYVRQMPGRIVGVSVDHDGRRGFTLTLQAREQHIRRAKATSNICTNQGLMVVAATIYMTLQGAQGLYNVAYQSHMNAATLKAKLADIGIQSRFSAPIFNEFVIEVSDATRYLAELQKAGIQGGINLTPYYPELGECVLVCATETKTTEDLDQYVASVIMENHHAIV